MAYVVVGLPTLVGLVYFSGVLDRPGFEEKDSLLTLDKQLLCIVATTTELKVGSNESRLLSATRTGIEASPQGKDIMRNAARLYGTVKGSERLGVSLYFDDPKAENEPRWACGWAVHSPGSFRDTEQFIEDIQQASGLKTETIRLVRLGRDLCLKCSVPWRTKWTPIVGAYIHWKRAYKLYLERGFMSTSGRAGAEGSVAVEFRKEGSDGSIDFIDYVIMFGNTQVIWDDAFPLENIDQYSKDIPSCQGMSSTHDETDFSEDFDSN